MVSENWAPIRAVAICSMSLFTPSRRVPGLPSTSPPTSSAAILVVVSTTKYTSVPPVATGPGASAGTIGRSTMITASTTMIARSTQKTRLAVPRTANIRHTVKASIGSAITDTRPIGRVGSIVRTELFTGAPATRAEVAG